MLALYGGWEEPLVDANVGHGYLDAESVVLTTDCLRVSSVEEPCD